MSWPKPLVASGCPGRGYVARAPLARPAVFFDRDGVLNIDHDFVHRPEEFEWVEGAREAVLAAHMAGFATVVVTNQSGVGRGLYTAQDVEALGYWMAEQAPFDALYYCPHTDSDNCSGRKPGPGMLLTAIAELGLEREGSFLVGDRDRDVAAAVAAGIPGLLYAGGDLIDWIDGARPGWRNAGRLAPGPSGTP